MEPEMMNSERSGDPAADMQDIAAVQVRGQGPTNIAAGRDRTEKKKASGWWLAIVSRPSPFGARDRQGEEPVSVVNLSSSSFFLLFLELPRRCESSLHLYELPRA